MTVLEDLYPDVSVTAQWVKEFRIGCPAESKDFDGSVWLMFLQVNYQWQGPFSTLERPAHAAANLMQCLSS